MSDKRSNDKDTNKAADTKAADAKETAKTEAAPPDVTKYTYDPEIIYNVTNLTDTPQILGEFGTLYPGEGREIQAIALSGTDLQRVEHLINPETFSVEEATGERPGSGEGEEAPPTAAPVNRDVPYLGGTGTVGSTLNCTMGNWDNVPDSYTYQFKSDGTTDLTGSGADYIVVEGDSGHSITCVVTATNALGSTAAPPSNAVVVGVTRSAPPPGNKK